MECGIVSQVVAFPQEQAVHWADLGVFGEVG